MTQQSSSMALSSREQDAKLLAKAVRIDVLRRRKALGYPLGIATGVLAAVGGLCGTGLVFLGVTGAYQLVGVALALVTIAPAFVVAKWRSETSTELRILTGGAES